MKQLLTKNKTSILLIMIVFLGGLLRFYNLNWGAPFYFHPDERNIADLISSLDSSKLDFLLKGTFAYGTLVSNIVFFIKSLTFPILRIFGFQDSFSQSVVILRLISSLSSSLTTIIVFLIGYQTLSREKALLAAFFTTFSVGLIQAAHFGVYESILTFMYSLLLFLSLMYIKTRKVTYIFLSALTISLSTAIKINSMITLIIPLGLLAIHIYSKKIDRVRGFAYGFSIMSFSLLITILASPYYLTEQFKEMFSYEASLLTGSLPVFYTGEFFNTTPILYQYARVLPFLINPILTIILIPLLFYVLYRGFKRKNNFYFLTILFFLILFIPNTLLFAKWTRYLLPTLPLIYIIISIGVIDFLDTFPKKFKALKSGAIGIMAIISVIFAFSYLSGVFIREDTRISASNWASQNIPKDAKILSEVYDLGIIPFNIYFTNISLFNFYDLENSPSNKIELEEQLKNTDYIILPSQRIYKSRIINKDKFPHGFNFYSELFSGNLGFEKTYETSCDILCRITYLGDPVFNFEETTSVFDRPTLLIFKRK